jgi:predicted house-cleaning noncanonical NTP pyrophosphatase (MazG superfamily)
MNYEEIARYIGNNGVYTGNMVDRLCEIIEENAQEIKELTATNEDLEEQLQDFRQWVTSLQGEVSELTEGVK